MKYSIFVYIIALVAVTSSKIIHNYPKPCHKSDPEIRRCYLDMFNKLVSYIPTGIREFNIPPLDPLEEDIIRIREVYALSTFIDAVAKNTKIVGLSQVIIDDLNVDTDNLLFETNITFPRLDVFTNYKLSFKSPNNPFELQGSYVGVFTDVKLNLVAQLKRIKKKAVKYFAVDSFKPKITIAHGHVKLITNNQEDQPLADFVSKTFNENNEPGLQILNLVSTKYVGDILRSRLEQALVQIPLEKFLIE